MNIGSTMAGTSSPAQGTQGNGQAATPASAKTAASRKAGPAADGSAGRGAAIGMASFGEMLESVDAGGRQAVPRAPDDAPRGWHARGQGWRGLDLPEPRHTDADEDAAAEGTKEADADGGVAWAGLAAAAEDRPAPSREPAAAASASADDAEPQADGPDEQQRRQPAPAAPAARKAQALPAQPQPQPQAPAEASPPAPDREARAASSGAAEGGRAPTGAPAEAATTASAAESRVTVVSSQVLPAPAAASPLSPTGTAFLASLRAEAPPAQHSPAVPDAALDQQPAAAKPVTTLKIQLHPAELGTVTVRMSGSGEQLTIEVQVENSEARHRLSSDSDAIVKALRGVGYDVDRIVVQQASSTPPSPGGGAGRENAFTAQDGRAGERQGQPGRQDTGQQNERNGQGTASGGGDRSEARGSGVYI